MRLSMRIPVIVEGTQSIQLGRSTMTKWMNSAKASIPGIILALFSAHTALAQTNILGSNLIVNGGAEAGTAGKTTASIVASVPGWTRTGNATVLSYDLTNYLLSTEPAPQSRGFQYFVTGGGTSTLTQDVDVSSAATAISAGTIKYTASAYLGKALQSDY